MKYPKIALPLCMNGKFGVWPTRPCEWVDAIRSHSFTLHGSLSIGFMRFGQCLERINQPNDGIVGDTTIYPFNSHLRRENEKSTCESVTIFVVWTQHCTIVTLSICSRWFYCGQQWFKSRSSDLLAPQLSSRSHNATKLLRLIYSLICQSMRKWHRTVLRTKIPTTKTTHDFLHIASFIIADRSYYFATFHFMVHEIRCV